MTIVPFYLFDFLSGAKLTGVTVAEQLLIHHASLAVHALHHHHRTPPRGLTEGAFALPPKDGPADATTIYT